MITISYLFLMHHYGKKSGNLQKCSKTEFACNLVCNFDNDNIESQKKQVAWVAELVDARDLKSLGLYACTSSILVPGTNKIKG